MNIEDITSSFTKDRQEELSKGLDKFKELSDTDPAAFIAMVKIASHITSTYNDKYESSVLPEIDLTGLMRHSKGGRFFNCGNAAKYLKRYMTDGYTKSNNPDDILKACHYLVLELDRKTNEE